MRIDTLEKVHDKQRAPIKAYDKQNALEVVYGEQEVFVEAYIEQKTPEKVRNKEIALEGHRCLKIMRSQ